MPVRAVRIGRDHRLGPDRRVRVPLGLSMDYEVVLLSGIREEHDAGADTNTATVLGVARTGGLVSSEVLILFLAFVALSRVPTTDVTILATAVALGIVIDGPSSAACSHRPRRAPRQRQVVAHLLRRNKR
ncbi:MMPL family transporter [Streptomyces sp. NPDC057900]|uniref:MMPL family transporter n=1 Tax=Streptomyces sp. NPDC057900 TaxID=3346274 RepID=UPI0036F02D40